MSIHSLRNNPNFKRHPYYSGKQIKIRSKRLNKDTYYYQPREPLKAGKYVAWLEFSFWPFEVLSKQEQKNAELSFNTVDDYIKIQESKLRGTEFKKARKIISGDITDNNENDTIIYYSIEGIGGTNSYSAFIAIFKNKGNKLVYITHRKVASRVQDEPIVIGKGVITLKTYKYAASDPRCCPSLKEVIKYKLIDGELRE